MAFGDLFRISTNIQSLQAQFNLNRINREIAQSQLRLATGLRIVRAEDDPAGFSIAIKTGARIAGLEQALRNTGDAKSVLDIAESHFDSILDILNQLKTKATQAANDTYGEEERGFIQLQVAALTEELTAIVNQAEYQGRNLLDGTYSANFQVGERPADALQVQINRGTAGQGFDAAGLGLNNLNMESHGDAQTAIGLIDDAISEVAGAVNRLGVNQTRLSIREEFLSRSIISNSAVRSRIIDVDFAKEVSNLIRLQIIQQAAIVALTQANLAPRVVLQLLN